MRQDPLFKGYHKDCFEFQPFGRMDGGKPYPGFGIRQVLIFSQERRVFQIFLEGALPGGVKSHFPDVFEAALEVFETLRGGLQMLFVVHLAEHPGDGGNGLFRGKGFEKPQELFQGG